MSIDNNQYDFLNTPALDAVRKLQESSTLAAIRELQLQLVVKAVLLMLVQILDIQYIIIPTQTIKLQSQTTTQN